MYCMFNQLGKYKVKDINVYIKPLIDKLLELWKGITMYDIPRLVGAQGEFQFHAMLVWKIHDANYGEDHLILFSIQSIRYGFLSMKTQFIFYESNLYLPL